MKSAILYRIAAVLLGLVALAHTLGFRQADPVWGVDTVLAGMRSVHFEVLGFRRTYWDLFVAAELSTGILYAFAAVLALAAWRSSTVGDPGPGGAWNSGPRRLTPHFVRPGAQRARMR